MMVDAVLEGFPPPAKLKAKAEKLEARKTELVEKLGNAKAPFPAASHYVDALCAADRPALRTPEGRAQAAETFRSLVDQVTPVPNNGELAIVLRGDLGAILRFAAGKK